MSSYQHRNLIRLIEQIDQMPDSDDAYSEWLTAKNHLDLLRANQTHDEVIVYACSKFTFIHGVIVSDDAISQPAQESLLDWNGNPFSARAGYVWGGGRPDVWIDDSSGLTSSGPLSEAQQLVFVRDFHGLKGPDAVTFEVLQEYSHITETHWRPDENAYCRFDENGDFDPIVSITSSRDAGEVTLVSFKRPQLEEYLAASHSVLVQTFDFTFFKSGEFTRWPDDIDETVTETDDLIYRQKIDPGKASYTSGVQISRPSRTETEIFNSIRDPWSIGKQNIGVEFIAFDWRNGRIAEISTDPSSTTNYFESDDNSLPYEVSPAFFRPEVLHKYKADQDKYTVSEESRFIHCRGSWELRTYDINEEGQIHTYIRYLRNLPHQEQLYWKSFNEEPKSGISERALESDFKGEWTQTTRPLEKVLAIARRWAEADVAWWNRGEESLRGRVNTPWTSSRDEWARAFSDLATLIIEGFVVSEIRSRLEGSGIAFEAQERSLKLIERFLVGHEAVADRERLVGLRTVQDVRSQVGSHRRGGVARDLANDALMEHGGYTTHFESVCEIVVQELEMIERTFS